MTSKYISNKSLTFLTWFNIPIYCRVNRAFIIKFRQYEFDYKSLYGAKILEFNKNMKIREKYFPLISRNKSCMHLIKWDLFGFSDVFFCWFTHQFNKNKATKSPGWIRDFQRVHNIHITQIYLTYWKISLMLIIIIKIFEWK